MKSKKKKVGLCGMTSVNSSDHSSSFIIWQTTKSHNEILLQYPGYPERPTVRSRLVRRGRTVGYISHLFFQLFVENIYSLGFTFSCVYIYPFCFCQWHIFRPRNMPHYRANEVEQNNVIKLQNPECPRSRWLVWGINGKFFLYWNSCLSLI